MIKSTVVAIFQIISISCVFGQTSSDTSAKWNSIDDPSNRSVFDKDERSEANTKWGYADYSRATATMVYKDRVIGDKVFAPTLRQELTARFGNHPFEEVRFLDQPIAGGCTGFLIAPDVLVTAGHCVNEMDKLLSVVWIFDYTTDVPYNSETYSLTIPEKNQYRGVEILDSKMTCDFDAGILDEDYCIIRLDRKTDRKPFKFRTNGTIKQFDLVASIGSPTGLPLKVSDSGFVIYSTCMDAPKAFQHNLDVFGGNSGGPVFNKKGFIEGITVWGPAIDYYFDESSQTIKHATYHVFNYGQDSQIIVDGNYSYKILSTNPELIKYMVYRNLEIAIEDDNTIEFDEWGKIYPWAFTKTFIDKDPLFATAIQKSNDYYASEILNNTDFDINQFDKNHNPMIYLIAKTNQIELLRKATKNIPSMDINLKNNNGETALMIATFFGYTEMVRALLDAGANSILIDNYGYTARDIAKTSDHKDINKMLKKAEKGKRY